MNNEVLTYSFMRKVAFPHREGYWITKPLDLRVLERESLGIETEDYLNSVIVFPIS